MRQVYFILLLIFGTTPTIVFGQNAKCHRSTEGTDFWFGFMESRNYNPGHYIEITVTAREATTFSITIGAAKTPYQGIFTVASNDSKQIRIPWDMVEALGSESIQSKGIHLVSEKPVNVYALNYDRNSADVAVIYPTESLGKEYFAMCYEVNINESNNGNYGNGRNSEFLVVATEDSTEVLILPSKVTDKLVKAGDSIIIILNKGEVYQVQSKNRNNLTGQGDLTQSYIQSNKPVAFYSGSLATTVPATSGMSAWDHLYEQIPPIPSWGREYYTVPLKSRDQDRYRIMAAENNTSIKITGKSNITLNRGEFTEIVLYSNEPSRIIADKPIMVAQFSQSNKVDNVGDPFMIILSSVTQSKNDVTFVAYDSDIIQNYFVNIISLTAEINNIRYDGNSITGSFKTFPEGDYSYAQMDITPGTHRINNTNPDHGFLAYVYGYGGVESYGYGVGFNLDLVLDLGQSIDFEGDTLVVCYGSSVVLDAGPYFDNYLWNTGDSTQKITVNTGDLYWAMGTTTDGCVQRDSIYVLVSKPEKPEIGNDTSGCAPQNIPLDAGSGYAKYEWNTGDSTQIIDANETGIYSVKVYDKYGCYKSDTMSLTVFPVPTISMTDNNLACGTKSRTLNLQFEGADENMLENGSMIWSSNQPDKLTFSNQTNQSTEIQVTEYGVYEVSNKFTTPDGCVISDTLKLQFAETPTSKIGFADENPEDKCGGYHREIIYSGNATPNANYNWDFGGSQAESIDWNLYSVSLGVYNSNPVVSLVVEENGCWSDTTRLPIGANPDFTMDTEKSRACDSATIHFSGKLKTPDALYFQWDFGDGSSISNLQNPSHFYADTGKYNVRLLITNQLNGCQAGYTIDEMVKIFPTPEAEIVVDPGFCYDKTVEVHYLQSIDSSFCTWDFEGASKIGDGNDSITVLLENQIATIRLQVEEYGCKSIWTESTTKRKPLFDIITDISEGCQPLQILAQSSTSDENIEFKWLTDSLVTNGDQQNFLLPNAGKYDFALSAYSMLTGCSDTIMKKDFVLVRPKPDAQFEVDFPAAIIEQANLHFTNLTNDIDIFNWDFGDGFNSTEENPLHTYNVLGKFPVELIVESEFGCIDTALMEVEILPFNVYTPNAFRPNSDIPENREFMPVGVGVNPEEFQIQIYNRWGEIIFESNNLDYKWDGTTKSNNPAPMGNYIWKADFSDIQGFKHSMKGQVLLIR